MHCLHFNLWETILRGNELIVSVELDDFWQKALQCILQNVPQKALQYMKTLKLYMIYNFKHH